MSRGHWLEARASVVNVCIVAIMAACVALLLTPRTSVYVIQPPREDIEAVPEPALPGDHDAFRIAGRAE